MGVCSKRHITGFLPSSVTFHESDNDKNIDFSKQAGHNIVLIPAYWPPGGFVDVDLRLHP